MLRLFLGLLLCSISSGCFSEAPPPTSVTTPTLLPPREHRPFLQHAHKIQGRYQTLSGPWSIVRTPRGEHSIPQVVLMHQRPATAQAGDTLLLTLYRYHYIDDHWLLLDEYRDLPVLHPIRDGFLKDYNFDGQLDLYLIDRASTAPLVVGQLLTFENEGHVWHPTLSQVANLRVDLYHRQLTGTHLHYCPETKVYAPCERAYVWKGGQVEMMEGVCGCVGVE